MPELYNTFATNLGTANLLKILLTARISVEKILEPEAIDLLEPIKDLTVVTSSFHELASKERRNPSSQLTLLSSTDQFHLHSIIGSTSTMIQGCLELINHLQTWVADFNIIYERNTTKPLLADQGWFEEISQVLPLHTEILQILLSAANLLYSKNDTDDDGNLSAEAGSLSSTLNHQIALIKPRLENANEHIIEEVKCHFILIVVSLITYVSC